MEREAKRVFRPTLSGVSVNGLGYDSVVSPVMDTGVCQCKYCHSMKKFVLAEIALKLRAFVQLFSVSKKYAVVCSSCKNGYYVDDAQKDAILYHGAGVEVGDDGLVISMPGAGKDLPSAHDISSGRVCRHCGREQPGQGSFCVYCGKPVYDVDSAIRSDDNDR